MYEGLTYKTIIAATLPKLYAALAEAKADGWEVQGETTLESDGNFYQLMIKHNFHFNETRLQLA